MIKKISIISIALLICYFFYDNYLVNKKEFEKKFPRRFKFHQIKFSQLDTISNEFVDAVIFDLGLSSIQLNMFFKKLIVSFLARKNKKAVDVWSKKSVKNQEKIFKTRVNILSFKNTIKFI